MQILFSRGSVWHLQRCASWHWHRCCDSLWYSILVPRMNRVALTYLLIWTFTNSLQEEIGCPWSWIWHTPGGKSCKPFRDLWLLTHAGFKYNRLPWFWISHYDVIAISLLPEFPHLLFAFARRLCLTELSCNIKLSQKVPPNNKRCPTVRRSLLFESSSCVLWFHSIMSPSGSKCRLRFLWIRRQDNTMA